MNISLTVVICIITFLISYRGFTDRVLFDNLKHHPYTESRNKEYFRFITSGFLHGSWIHLLINLFVLYEFGRVVEFLYRQNFGELKGGFIFILMYFLTLIAADIPSYIKHKDNPGYSAIGASGAVSGIVFIYVLFFPWHTLKLYGIIPIYAIVAAIAYAVYSSWASKNRNDNIGHDAHLYGALFGVLFTVIADPSIVSNFVNQLKELPF